MTGNLFCAAALLLGPQSASAQSIDNIFVGGSRYIYDLYRGESVEESVSRLPNKLIVAKTMLPRMAKIYRDCAREAEFRGKVQAIANVYSSHFSTVTLERNPSMTDAKFKASVSCVTAAVGQAAQPRAIHKPVSNVIYRPAKTAKAAAPAYASPSASFSVRSEQLPQAQKTSAQCARSSGYRGAAHLQVVRYKDSLAKLSLVRSGNMTNDQYNKTLSCMKTKIAAI
jgi:hypothetical protein